MAESVGYATLDVIPSMRGFRGALERGTGREFERVGKAGGRRLGDAAGKEASGRLKSSLGDAIRGAFAPAAGILAGAGIVQGFRAIVGAASEAEQSVGGVQAVFGQYANQVLKDSERAAQGLGLSANSYRELVTVSSALLKNKGLADFAKQGENLVKIGADLAAQYGGSTREAVEALNAAMRGESDPIERYAVSLNETAVNAKLAEQGLGGLEGAALETAKAQARLQLVQEQTADAQGAFARESNTLAGAMSRLRAEAGDMAAEAGTKLLPVLTDLANFARKDILPAVRDMGGVIVDAAKGFASLPTPVRTATGALLAFRAAQATGLTGSAASATRNALGRMADGFNNLRGRAASAASEYRSMRSAQLTFVNGAPKFTAATGRMSASMGALRAATAGAGGVMRRGLGGVMNMLGGPWGLAMAAGAFAAGKFMQKQQEAKAYADALKESLDKQTGAITANTRATVIDRLEKDGLLRQADKLGISLSTITEAALGNEGAMSLLNDMYRKAADNVGAYANESGSIVGGYDKQRVALGNLIEALGGEAEGLERVAAEAERKRRADQRSASTTDNTVTRAARDYRGELDKARASIQKLIDKENERRNKNASDFQAQTRIASALADARKEAEEGRRTLNLNTEAGRANRDALSQVADAWNGASRKVRTAEGAYESMRTRFIKIARQMGATKDEAKQLADDLLSIPPKVDPRFSVPGLPKVLEDIKRLKEEWAAFRRNRVIQLEVRSPTGEEFGHGMGTAPSAAPNQPRSNGRGVQNQTNIHVDRVETADPGRFLEDMQRRQRLAALGGA